MQSLTIDFNNIDQLRTVIRNFVYNEKGEYQKRLKLAEEGFAYYNNFDQIKCTGAAAIDEVNNWLKQKGSNPLHSADNRISFNRHRVVVDQKVGYLFSDPPQFDMPADEDKENDVLKRVNDTVGAAWPKVIRQLGLDASNTGSAWLTYWQDKVGWNYWFVNPLTCVPIYDRSTVKKRLLYMIRVYGYNDNNGNPCTRYEVYSDTQVAYLIKPEASSTVKTPAIEYETLPNGNYNIQPHQYGRVPFIEFQNNAKGIPDLVMYKDIIDAIDKLLSGFANDLDDIQEVLWVIKNYNGEKEVPIYNKDGTVKTDEDGNEITRPVDVPQMMKLKKWLSVDQDGGVEAIKGEIPYQARQAFYKILDAEFWTSAMAVNPNPPTGTGNQSGVYIDYLYGLLEDKSGLLETEFRASIDEFLKAILHSMGADENTQFVQTWKRTKPQNDTEVAGILSSTPDTVMSDETKTKMHPYVTDWQAERAQIEKEQAEKQEQRKQMFGNDDVPPENEPSGSKENPKEGVQDGQQ